jgi:sugar (pentulose or hexulose) kinase
MGIHDSNSSLLPYLIQSEGGFALNSTGTWCVAMHPMEAAHFMEDEIGLMVYYNLDAFFRPVKTSNFMGGLEFEKYSGLIGRFSGADKIPAFNFPVYERVLSNCKQFILPAIVRGTGQFPDSSARAEDGNKIYRYTDIVSEKSIPEFFKNPEKAYAVLNLSLAIQTRVTLERAGVNDGVKIYIEGGFRKNDAYCSLLSALFPKSEIVLSGLREATAFGAALLGKAALEGKNIMELKGDFKIESEDINTLSMTGINAYYKAWLEKARS